MVIVTGWFLWLLASLGSTSAVYANDSVLPWFNWQKATDDWGGIRTKLNDAGVDPELNYTTDILFNPIGGFNQTGAYADLWEGSFNFDLNQLANWQGADLFIGHVYSGGEDLSGKAIGNIFDVAQTYSGQGWRLTRVKLTQQFFDDRFEVALGRLSAGTYFVTSPVGDYYVNSALNDNPAGVFYNIDSLFTSTRAQWGVRAAARFTSDFTVAAGVYNADPSVGDTDKHGFDFTLNPNKGVLVLSQATWKPTFLHRGQELPGAYRFGAYVDTSRYYEIDPRITDPSYIRGSWGLYSIVEQMVYQEKGDEGLTLWGSFVIAPQQSISTLPFSTYLGTYYKGLFELRPDDVTAGVIGAGFFSEDLPGQSSEWFIELNHRFQFAPWFYLTTDFQYIVNPSGRNSIDDAAVVGTEISITF
ncbi:carbohydrate porin [Pseudovibrio flavus]|uniref:carbohydrate porin n=1 Tax=Pseudovibrio flavus TaxID=2529854 RepID=UPI0012BBFAB5|nr:carbohydrate porin [Pseudovibrio flavus]